MYNFHQKGYIAVGNTFIKSLGCTLAVVLERILSEYQQAEKNNLLYDNYFCINLADVAMQTGLKEEECLESLNKLNGLGLIEITKFEKYFKIFIKETNIINFEKVKEQEIGYKPWNYSIYKTQKEGFNLMLRSNNNTSSKDDSWMYELARDENGNVIQF